MNSEFNFRRLDIIKLGLFYLIAALTIIYLKSYIITLLESSNGSCVINWRRF
ncbi:hypothetical protein [Winogradskyella haliclonae]|uniref:hypothetical protein n=1 Tax=Winogradskyella haliclonae TaxID=2048558 RepID=UPI00166CFFFC|nr:hypothetical protein [Winogradskyella haliclonae]